jgi:hypothetical protein
MASRSGSHEPKASHGRTEKLMLSEGCGRRAMLALAAIESPAAPGGQFADLCRENERRRRLKICKTITRISPAMTFRALNDSSSSIVVAWIAWERAATCIKKRPESRSQRLLVISGGRESCRNTNFFPDVESGKRICKLPWRVSVTGVPTTNTS